MTEETKVWVVWLPKICVAGVYTTLEQAMKAMSKELQTFHPSLTFNIREDSQIAQYVAANHKPGESVHGVVMLYVMDHEPNSVSFLDFFHE